MIAVRRHFVDGPFGQVHARLTPPVEGATPLVCLHATAYSSQSFLPLMAALAPSRQVIAIDAPGYGESARPAAPPTMADYAAAVLAAAAELAPDRMAVLGYHTGCYIASEMALLAPERIMAMAMIGIPYFQAIDLAYWQARLSHRHSLGPDLDQFRERWDYFVTQRHPDVSDARGFANFVDELKAWPHGWWAHDAMFAYDSDARLPQVEQPVLVLNPQGHLAEPSRVAGAMMPGATVIELPDLSGPILEIAPSRIARELDCWLGPLSAPASPLTFARSLP